MAVLARHIAIALAACLPLLASPAVAVFGGKPPGASTGLARSLAAIVYQTDDGAHLCTAIALAPRLLLTAAHCTEGDKSLIKIIFSTDLKDIAADRLRAVVEVARPDKTAASEGTYAYNNPDDIALLLLDTEAPAGTQFATLAGAGEPAARIVIAGYGATSELRKPDASGKRQLGFDRQLRVTTLPLASTSPDLLVADQTTGTGACTGDSGGPALAPGADLRVVGVLIGVSSARATNDYCRGKAWFASLARWQPWLETTAKSLGQPLP